MKVRIKRVDANLPLPKYETDGAVGFDFVCREETVIEPGKVELVPGNVIVEVPKGYMLAATMRSSVPRKRGLLIPHGFGVIDQDYCGPHDEIKLQVYNFTDKPVTVNRGDRIAQGIFVPVQKVEFEEVDQIKEESRGGFGSTGDKIK